jgi:hypothetical protein
MTLCNPPLSRPSLDESSSSLARPAHEGKTNSDNEQDEEDPNEGSICLSHSTPTDDIILCLVSIAVVVFHVANSNDFPNR